MACQLPTDCLDEILEHLEEDRITLHSCLLVNRHWCKISVRILWRDIWSFSHKCPSIVAKSILSTLIACLPNESKEFLQKNKIFISTPTSKPPLFNYASFCKVLSICEIDRIINDILSLKDRNCLVVDEVVKMFMNQISSLKKLHYRYNSTYHRSISFPGMRDLSELRCSSNLPSEFFISLQSLSIEFPNDDVSNELKELISLQNNLKSLTLIEYAEVCWTNTTIIPSLTKHSNTITKLHLHTSYYNLPLSFISLLLNLQEIIFSFFYGYFENLKMLQDVNFPKLKILKFPYNCPKPLYVMKFLENNGKNLQKFYTYKKNNSLNLSIAKFCPNLKSLFIVFNNGEVDILKNIFINCHQLESIKIWCGGKRYYLTEKEIFETVVNYSPNNFCELKIILNLNYISSKDLESFLISWKNRIPKKLLRLIFITNYSSIEVSEKI